MERRGWDGTAVALPTANRVLRHFEREPLLVSIIIPTGGHMPILRKCLAGIFNRTDYRNVEVVVIYNNDTRREVFPYLEKIARNPRVTIIDAKGPFNFSESCNLGAAAARGEVLIFLNDDVVVISRDWVQSLLECIEIPRVGAVSPKLLYENNRIQHAGMVAGTRRLNGTAFHGYPRDTSANMNLAQSTREVSVLSAACLAMRKTVFSEVGGFDTVNTPREHSDVDLCFRIRELGYSCVYTPHAELTHIGHVSMGAAEAGGKVFGQNKHDIFIMKRFGAFLADDPYFTRPMRDILYIDSQEEFRFYPRKPRPGHEDTAIAVTVGKAPQTLDILIFSHDLTESGAPRAAFDVARTLKDAGHFVVVASPSDGPHRERLRDVGVDVIVDELLLSQDRHVLAFARNFDKVICNTIVCWPAVEQLHEVVDTYWYVHEGELIRHFVETVPGFLEVLNQGISTWAACPLAARVLATYGVAPRVIEYGIGGRAELHLPPNRGAEKIVIGVFGSYEGRKGQDLAIHGMLGISEDLRSKAELRLFGRTQDVKFHDELKQVVSGDHSIVLFGEVDHDECLKQMAACDVILVPSRDDPLPFVALDALSLGKVLVCSKTTGVSEYLEDGQSGLILRENTPEEIARVLESVITNSQLRATLGGGAREVYERTFSVQKFAEKLHSALGLWMTLGDGGQLTPCYPFPPLFAE
jgi:GT2 family glycosyltransferase